MNGGRAVDPRDMQRGWMPVLLMPLGIPAIVLLGVVSGR